MWQISTVAHKRNGKIFLLTVKSISPRQKISFTTAKSILPTAQYKCFLFLRLRNKPTQQNNMLCHDHIFLLGIMTHDQSESKLNNVVIYERNNYPWVLSTEWT